MLDTGSEDKPHWAAGIIGGKHMEEPWISELPTTKHRFLNGQVYMTSCGASIVMSLVEDQMHIAVHSGNISSFYQCLAVNFRTFAII